MKNFSFVLLAVFVLLLSSCLNCIKPYKIYKEPVADIKNRFIMNVVYLSTDKKLKTAYYFFENGLVKDIMLFEKTPQDSILMDPYMIHAPFNPNYLLSKYDFNNKELWGNYKVTSDSTMIFQQFGKCNDCFCGRMVLETKTKILNDSTLIIYPTYAYDLKTFFDQDTILCYYHPTDFKPDSSQAWFLKKHWYKKGLHESRK